jgi:hypothetical protein
MSAPKLASERQTAVPIPFDLLAPVTIAILFSSEIIDVPSILYREDKQLEINRDAISHKRKMDTNYRYPHDGFMIHSSLRIL